MGQPLTMVMISVGVSMRGPAIFLLWQQPSVPAYNWAMSTLSSAINQVEVLARSIDRAGTKMAPEVARFFLDLELSDADSRTLDALTEKSRLATLTPAEQADLDEYRRVGRLVELTKVKAKVAMKG
jgi:hypothetical protein